MGRLEIFVVCLAENVFSFLQFLRIEILADINSRSSFIVIRIIFFLFLYLSIFTQKGCTLSIIVDRIWFDPYWRTTGERKFHLITIKFERWMEVSIGSVWLKCFLLIFNLALSLENERVKVIIMHEQHIWIVETSIGRSRLKCFPFLKKRKKQK